MYQGQNTEVRYPQLAKEPLITSRVRANPQNRLWAKTFDFLWIQSFTFLFSLLWSPLAWIVPLLAWTYVDRLGRGQSPGKWLLGLHAIEVRRGERISYYNGLVRNLPFLMLSLAFSVQYLWSGFILVPALLWIAIDSFFIFQLRSGVRSGDILGSTRVWDYKDHHTKFLEQFLKEEENV